MSRKKSNVPTEKRSQPSEPPTVEPPRLAATGAEADRPEQPKVRVVIGEERLTAKELKERFAVNLDWLITIVGLNRKDAAHVIGIPYPLMRRLVSAGVSCTDERNIKSLTLIADYFALPRVDDLWQDRLLLRLLGNKSLGNRFVDKFRPNLNAAWESRLAGTRPLPGEERVLLGHALDIEPLRPPAPQPDPYPSRIAAILHSPKAETFKNIINDYYEAVTGEKVTHDSENS